jgi:expansin (peptidoglycan-binding protein)
MKKFFSFTIAVFILSACTQNNASVNRRTKADLAIPKQTLSLADAEKILGEKAHLTDSSVSTEQGTLIFKSSYKADAADPKNGKTGVVYFLIEEYLSDSSAHQVYASIKKANENHGIKTLEGLGDEAYFHSDNENFYFIMVRKGNTSFRIKVNKITGNTSLDEFNSIAKKITETL